MTLKEIKGQVIVLLVTATITFVAYSSQIGILWSFFGGATLHTALILIPFNVFVIMIYINYALTCLTDPGTVPPNWIPQQQHHHHLEVKRSTHAPRFCKTCNNYKPPRSHHCRTCGKCVLKMDHHCPWINNCVGFANYCHFLRFLAYVEVSSIYLITLLGCRLANIVQNQQQSLVSSTEWGLLGINLVLCALIITGVAILSSYHVYCVSTNTTTIEGWEKGKSLTLKSMGTVHDVMYPYDQGVMNNIKFVLGRQPLFWFWPRQMEGSGLSFPINITHLHTKGNTVAIEPVELDDINNDDKRSSVYSTWTTHTNYTQYSGGGDDDGNNHDTVAKDHVTQVEPSHQHLSALRSKPSTTTLHTPTTPGSILTFASTASTLVDPRSRRPSDTTNNLFGPGGQYHVPPLKNHRAKHCIECQEVFHLFKQKYNCKNCGHVVCSDCSKQRRTLPKFGYDRQVLSQQVCDKYVNVSFLVLIPSAVRCCDTCSLHISMQEMNSGTLASQSLKQLKHYINSYNLPAQHALEKNDLVKLIFNTRPLTNQNERHYRMLRDRQYAAQVAKDRPTGDQTGGGGGGDFFEDNPITAAFNKFSEIFTEPTTPQTSTSSTPPRRQPQQQQQGPRNPSPQPQQTTRTPYHPTYPPHVPFYPSYIHQEQPPLHRSTPSQRPSERPASTQPTTSSSQPSPRRPTSPPPSQPQPASRPTSPSVTLKEMVTQSIDPATLSVRTLKTILRDSHVELNFALEKKELVNRVQQLLADEKKLKRDRRADENDDDDDEHVCRICYDAQQNCVFLNCGHMATCIDCGLKLVETKNECPICRDSIVRVVRVFRS